MERVTAIIDRDLNRKIKIVCSDRLAFHANSLYSNYLFINMQQQLEVVDDVRRYIAAQIEDLSARGAIPWRHQTQIEESLANLSEGNFLQASLAWINFHSGVSYWSPQVIKNKLDGVKKLSKEATAYYCSLLERIPEDSQDLARTAFTWVLGSRKPLNILELQHAIAISSGQNSWADLVESLAFNLEVQFPQAFGYLLQVQPDRHVNFAHSTIKELLTSSSTASESATNSKVLSKYLIQESDIDAELAKCCIIILSFRDFVRLRDIAREALTDRIRDFLLSALQTDQSLANLNFSEYDEGADSASRKSFDSESEEIKELTRTMSQANLDPQTYTLFSYCVSYWNYHCSQAATNPEVEASLTQFILLRQSYFFHLVAMLLGMARVHRTPFWRSVDQFKRVPPLHFIMRIGDHPAVVWNLIQQGQNINGVDCHGWTPLEWALVEGRKASLDTLLAQDSIKVNGVVECPLVLSCKADARVDVITRLLHDPRIDINAKSSEGWTVLHWCLSRQKYRSIVDHLLSRKDLDIHMTDGRGITYLEQLFEEGELEDMAIKLISRADVPMNWFVKTPKRQKPSWVKANSYHTEREDATPSSYLSRASFLQWYRIEELILNVDPLQAVLVEEDGMGLLARYAFHGVEKRLIYLLEQLPANLFTDHGENGAELMLLCAQQDWEQIVRELSNKFSISQISSDKTGRTIAHWACELRWKSIPAWISSSLDKTWLNKQSNDGRTALHVAAEQRNYLACKCLLEAGAGYLFRDKSGKLPIHIAAEEGHRAIVYLLLQCPVLDYGKDLEGRALLHYLSMWHSDIFLRQCLWALRPSFNVVDHHRRTPLHYAAIFGNYRAMGILLELGANSNAKDDCNATPLHRALLEGSLPCVELLIRYGADPELLDHFGRNALHLSIRSEVPELLNYVLGIIKGNPYKARSWIRHTDVYGQTALHRICLWPTATGVGEPSGINEYVLQSMPVISTNSSRGVASYISTLLALGADINATDLAGYTPLHVALKFGYTVAAEALLSWPEIDVRICDNAGLSVLDWAVVERHENVAELIIRRGGEHTDGWWHRLKPLYQPWKDDVEDGLEDIKESGPITKYPSETDFNVTTALESYT
ncbi:hypothetical protein ACMFMF_005637 [Clarireedia jacksonii]